MLCAQLKRKSPLDFQINNLYQIKWLECGFIWSPKYWWIYCCYNLYVSFLCGNPSLLKMIFIIPILIFLLSFWHSKWQVNIS